MDKQVGLKQSKYKAHKSAHNSGNAPKIDLNLRILLCLLHPQFRLGIKDESNQARFLGLLDCNENRMADIFNDGLELNFFATLEKNGSLILHEPAAPVE